MQNCSEFLLYCLAPQTTSCFQENAPAGKEILIADGEVLPGRDKTMILSQLCPTKLPHSPVPIAATPDLI